MIRLSLKIALLSIPELIEYCRTVVAAMTGNINFTTPNPALLDITAAIDLLETTYQALTGDHNAKRLQLDLRDDLNALMMQLKTYVENTSGDDLSVAQSSGIRPRKSPERQNSITTPENVLAVAGTNPGTGRISWDAVPNRTKYMVYSNSDFTDINNQEKWTLVGSTGQRFISVSGLTSAVKYAFFVVALGTRDVESEASDPALMMAA